MKGHTSAATIPYMKRILIGFLRLAAGSASTDIMFRGIGAVIRFLVLVSAVTGMQALLKPSAV